MAARSDNAVEDVIQPHLEAVPASSLEEVVPYRQHLQSYLDGLDDLKELPLWVSHYDFNEVNVLIDKDRAVTGLIDWELSPPPPPAPPLGANFGRIHTIAGEYTGAVFDRMPADVRRAVEKKIGLVQDAVMLVTLLEAFYFGNGTAGAGDISVKSLPKFLTHRIPLVRGDEPPYGD